MKTRAEKREGAIARLREAKFENSKIFQIFHERAAVFGAEDGEKQVAKKTWERNRAEHLEYLENLTDY